MKTYLWVPVVILIACPVTFATAEDAKQPHWKGTVRGEVIKIQDGAYVIEDSLGREVRLILSTDGVRDEDIQVGDEIVARTVHRGKETYIKSVKKIVSSGSSPVDASPWVSSVMEGEVLKIDGESYVVKEAAGREVRFKVDNRTWKDGNITVGDNIQVNLDDFQSVHAASVNKR
jgi:uncharacterized protein YdeI (BOF family)